jgi:hypothetical protein
MRIFRRKRKVIRIPTHRTRVSKGTLRFSVELEVEFPNVENSAKLIDKHRIIRGWEIDQDWSLDNGAEYRPRKSNKLYFKQDSLDQIREIIGLIKAHQGNIRPTCGLHVHINMEGFTNPQIVAIVKRFAKDQDKLYKQFNVLKSRIDGTAQKIPLTSLSKVTPEVIGLLRKKTFDYSSTDCEYLTDRTYGLNIQSLKKHHTLEFRMFNGTIQSDKIEKYIEWCLEFCLKACQDE